MARAQRCIGGVVSGPGRPCAIIDPIQMTKVSYVFTLVAAALLSCAAMRLVMDRFTSVFSLSRAMRLKPKASLTVRPPVAKFPEANVGWPSRFRESPQVVVVREPGVTHQHQADMAQLVERFRPGWRAPQNFEETRAWDHIRRVFGQQPSSVRGISSSGTYQDACVVKLHWDLDNGLEFICAGGVLVGIPPKSRR